VRGTLGLISQTVHARRWAPGNAPARAAPWPWKSAELESALDAHEGEAAAEAEDGYGEWYPDFEEVEALIEEAGTYLEDAPDELRELADYAITDRRSRLRQRHARHHLVR
jgi:hypothetical protein